MRRGLLLVVLGFVLALGARAEAQREPGWEVRIPERIELVAGEIGTLAISIAVDRPLVVSKDAPVMVELAAPGLSIKKPRLGRADAVDPEADAPRFAIPLKPSAPGEYKVRTRLQLWLCGARVCRPLEVRRETAVIVAAPPAAPTPDGGRALGP